MANKLRPYSYQSDNSWPHNYNILFEEDTLITGINTQRLADIWTSALNGAFTYGYLRRQAEENDELQTNKNTPT